MPTTHVAVTPIHLIVNTASGRAAPWHPWPGQQHHQADRDMLDRHALHWHRANRPDELPSVARRAAQAARQDGGVVVAVGGDGTINTVAQLCWAAGLPMGVMPGGTFNFFARQQGLATDPDEALRAIVRAVDEAHWRPVQVGLVNGQVFLVNASMGLYPRLLAQRERATDRFGRHRVVAMAAGLHGLLRPGPAARYRLAWLDDDARAPDVQRLEASTLFIGNNALQLAGVGLPDTDQVGSGALQAVMLSCSTSRWATARLLWRAATASLGDEPTIGTRTFTRLVVDRTDRYRGGPVRVAFDGERRWMRLPLQFEVGERPLWLVGGDDRTAPQPSPGAAQTGMCRRPINVPVG